MTRREAALILGVREHAKEEAVKDAHRKIMIANHPDAGPILHQAVEDLFSIRISLLHDMTIATVRRREQLPCHQDQ